MKKIFNLLFSFVLLTGIFVGIDTASATKVENSVKTVALANTKKEATYHFVDNKMVYAGKINSIENGAKRINHWHAKKVNINKNQWWKIGKNTYLKASENVVVINTKKMNDLGVNVDNYQN